MNCQFGIDFKKPSDDGWTSVKDKNPLQVETAGFVPLPVKMERFIQNGLIAQFNSSDFDSHDYRDMYLSPDTQILPSDDLETIQEKLNLQQKIALAAIPRKNLKLGDSGSNVVNAESPSQQFTSKDLSPKNEKLEDVSEKKE